MPGTLSRLGLNNSGFRQMTTKRDDKEGNNEKLVWVVDGCANGLSYRASLPYGVPPSTEQRRSLYTLVQYSRATVVDNNAEGNDGIVGFDTRGARLNTFGP